METLIVPLLWILLPSSVIGGFILFYHQRLTRRSPKPWDHISIVEEETPLHKMQTEQVQPLRLYLPINVISLDQQQKSAVDLWLKKLEPGTPVIITGSSCSLGGRASKTIARNRALELRNQLTSAGISLEQLSVKTVVGPARQTEAERTKDRWVELRYPLS